MRPNRTRVYAALLAARPQPVRVVEVDRRWSFDRTNGGLVLAGRHAPRGRDVPVCLGWLAITRGPASERFPATDQGDAALATSLRSFRVPGLREKALEAEADARALAAFLYEEELGFALVRDYTQITAEWHSFE